MIELNEEQRLQLAGPEPLALDPQTNMTYVLVPKDVYQQLRSFLDEDVRASAELVDRIMADDDANDPHLASYQGITRGQQ